MQKTDSPRIAIIGAGPIGLEAALYARKLGYNVTVYERGRVGEHVQRWGHVRLFSPFGMNATSLGRAAIFAQKARQAMPAPTDCITGREHFSAYLEPLAGCELLKGALAADSMIVSISRQGLLKHEMVGDSGRAQRPLRLLVRDKQGRERVELAEIVLDCSGTYARHRWLGDGGGPAIGEMASEASISYQLEDILGDKANAYAGKTVLVVGSGYSAATTVSNLAEMAIKHPASWVYWAVRTAGSQPIQRVANDPLRERDRLAVKANNLATRTDGNVEFHAGTVIEAVESAGQDKGFKVTARKPGKTITWNVDRVVANVGFSPDNTMYRELQVHECYASLGPMKVAAGLTKQTGRDCLQVAGCRPEELTNPEPDFYILGSKSYGRSSQFLLKVGFDQVRDVFKLITGKPRLDLYADTPS
jgi:thioredoxin reductase